MAAPPGDPVRKLVGLRASPEVIESIRQYYGLDQPIWTQYLLFVRALFDGELGQSIVYRMPVTELVASRMASTVFLFVYGVVLALMLTLALAVTAARNRGRWPDTAIRAFSTLGLGFPPFWIGLML